jgi:hypothetical protein
LPYLLLPSLRSCLHILRTRTKHTPHTHTPREQTTWLCGHGARLKNNVYLGEEYDGARESKLDGWNRQVSSSKQGRWGWRFQNHCGFISIAFLTLDSLRKEELVYSVLLSDEENLSLSTPPFAHNPCLNRCFVSVVSCALQQLCFSPLVRVLHPLPPPPHKLTHTRTHPMTLLFSILPQALRVSPCLVDALLVCVPACVLRAVLLTFWWAGLTAPEMWLLPGLITCSTIAQTTAPCLFFFSFFFLQVDLTGPCAWKRLIPDRRAQPQVLSTSHRRAPLRCCCSVQCVHVCSFVCFFVAVISIVLYGVRLFCFFVVFFRLALFGGKNSREPQKKARNLYFPAINNHQSTLTFSSPRALINRAAYSTRCSSAKV